MDLLNNNGKIVGVTTSFAAYTGLDAASQSVLLSYAVNSGAATMVSRRIRNDFYKDLANSIVLNADRIRTLNKINYLRVGGDFIFPPLGNNQLFVGEVFYRMRTISQSAGITLEQSDLDLESVLGKTKRALRIHFGMKMIIVLVVPAAVTTFAFYHAYSNCSNRPLGIGTVLGLSGILLLSFAAVGPVVRCATRFFNRFF